jgi:type VI secretion system protein ImpF
MAGIKPDQALLSSVIDRLLDSGEGAGNGSGKTHGQSLAELRVSVRRDLEALLNTPRRWRSWPPELTELEHSMISYGMPDVTGAQVASMAQREQFRRLIEDVIRDGEPRFKSVDVKLLENPPGLERVLRFRIEALIYAEPAPEPVAFDTQLDPATRNLAVRSPGDGR